MEQQNHMLLIKEFLSISEHSALFDSYIQAPTKQKKDILDALFKAFYKKIRAISYLNKSIHFEAKKFDNRLRKDRSRFQLILDKPSDEESDLTIVDLLIDETSIVSYNEIPFKKLEDYIQSPTLVKTIKKLTEKQKEILYLAYIKNMKDVEIAKHLCVSQQSVTKTKNIALRKVRGEISA